MRPHLRSFFLPCLLGLFACSGGSCSGCGGSAVQPIPGGFPIAERIDNAAQARLTTSGIQFVQDNISAIIETLVPGGLDFAIPAASGSTSGVDYMIRPDGGCTAHIEIQSFTLTPTPPNTLAGHIQVIVDSRDASGSHAGVPVHLTSLCVFGGCAIDTVCNADIDTHNGSRPYIGMVFDVDFAAETHPARMGYTKIVVRNAALASGEDVEDADIDFGGCSGISGLVVEGVVGLFKSTLISSIQTQLTGAIQGAIDSQLCTKQGTAGCPVGSHPDPAGTDATAVCKYDSDNTCVPQLLGTDGQGDLGAAFLGSLSPGTHAPGQFLLASGGDGEAVNGGMSLFMYGGFRSTDRTFTTSPAHNPCVPVVDPPPLPTVPRVDAFRGNVIPGTMTSADFGLGISEDFLNYAGYGMFDSGMLCLGVGTRTSQQLSTGLFSLLIQSLKSLAFPADAAPISLALRPQVPPTFHVGNTQMGDPLLTVSLPQLAMDFYVWSSERYVRFMTFTSDLTIPIDLTVTDGQVVPTLGSITADNATVTHSDSLTEDPATLAGLVQDVLSMFAGSLSSSIPAVSLPSIMGFDLQVPPDGVVGFNQSSESFVGVFANLALASASAPITVASDTEMQVDDVKIDPRPLALATWGQGPLPAVTIDLAAQSPAHGVDYEYSYRIDGMAWSPWTREPHLVVRDRALLFQARHVLEARSRIVGAPGSVDPTPARSEVLVDVLPPDVELTPTAAGLRVTAHDVISPTDALRYRTGLGDGAFSDWQALGDGATVTPPDAATPVQVEVIDEAGNVGHAQEKLIRGLPNPAAASGCGCTVPGQSSSGSPFAGFTFLMALALAVGLRRRRRCQRRTSPKRTRSRRGLMQIAFLFGLPLVLSIGGCSCGSSPDTTCGGMCMLAVPPATSGSICCPMTNMCMAYSLDDACDPGFTCASADDVTIDGSCTLSCSSCMPKAPLHPGLLATHLDMATESDGTVLLSGYSPGMPPSLRWGDLVVGTWDPTTMAASWDIIDGVPSDPPTADPSGWRGGVSTPGDDVGRWTSMVTSGSEVYVSYYDKTHGALKLATKSGDSWSVQTVDDDGDAGRYSSIALDASGNPVIAYLHIAAPDAGGVVKSSARVATASSPSPSGSADWTTTDVFTATIPCRPGMCNDGQTCVDSGLCVTPTSDCASACASGSVCTMGTCATALADAYVEDMPVAAGLYDQLAATPSGLALVFYDRTEGNLMGASDDGGSWGDAFLIDGYGVGDPAVGDSGIGASLFVDGDGVWHVSYVDGSEETLRYATVDAGTATTEVVDDGATDGAMPNPDGRHIVGDDSSIVVTPDGEVRIVYQDATSAHAMMARRARGATDWSVTVLDQTDATGFWLEQQLVGTTSYIATFWRKGGSDPDNGVRLFVVD